MALRDSPRHSAARYLLGGAVAIVVVAGAIRMFGSPTLSDLTRVSQRDASADKPAAADDRADTETSTATDTVELSSTQLASFKVAPVGYRVFPVRDQAIGAIDFDEDMSAQVFAPYQGRIVSLFAKVGDDVQKGQVLFTIESPDLIQAESNLITTAGLLQLTTKALARTKALYEAKGAAQKDLEQAVSDQQTADGNFKAAQDAVRIFGKMSEEIDKIVASRKIDPILVIPSPISGRVTARSAAPGLFVQPGSAPAPFTVADISTMWMLANVPEDSIPRYHVGQTVAVSVDAYPNRVFDGKISTIGSIVDPSTRRVMLRSEITDPEHLLRSGMFANFVINTGEAQHALAVPTDAVTREGDGTMTAWVTTDRKHFTRRQVTLGLQQHGYDEVLSGLQPGELIAADGALFLDSAAKGVVD
jgi:cobalt-zinc-cadmium efflux system membrane fusion protein